MESIFRRPWGSLTLDDVRSFLADAGDEGLTWEAKGTERPHPGSVQKHVSAFANSIGGFFIVGASREGKTGPWRIDPVELEGDEPGPWFSKVIRNNLSPVPWYDVKEWTQDEKRVAVVNVDPVAEPPCMTGSGDVFIRVSGESVKVVDPSVLGGLFERGRARMLGAEAEALRATDLTEPSSFSLSRIHRSCVSVSRSRRPDARRTSARGSSRSRSEMPSLPPPRGSHESP